MIRVIISTLSLLLISLFGTPTTNDKSRILNRKSSKEQQRKEFKNHLNIWVQMNFGLIALAAIVFLLAVFVILCFWIVGVSAVESGAMRNFIHGGV